MPGGSLGRLSSRLNRREAQVLRLVLAAKTQDMQKVAHVKFVDDARQRL
jgi:hypothetical protein